MISDSVETAALEELAGQCHSYAAAVRRRQDPPPPRRGATQISSAAGSHRTPALRIRHFPDPRTRRYPRPNEEDSRGQTLQTAYCR